MIDDYYYNFTEVETEAQCLKSPVKKTYYFKTGCQARIWALTSVLYVLSYVNYFSQVIFHHTSFILSTDAVPEGTGADLIKVIIEKIYQYKTKGENKIFRV